MRSDTDTIPFEVEALRTHVDGLTIAGKNVRKAHAHLQSAKTILELTSVRRIFAIDHFCRQNLTCMRFEFIEAQAGIEKVGSSRYGIAQSIFN